LQLDPRRWLRGDDVGLHGAFRLVAVPVGHAHDPPLGLSQLTLQLCRPEIGFRGTDPILCRETALDLRSLSRFVPLDLESSGLRP
jgi:hypothetical protein